MLRWKVLLVSLAALGVFLGGSALPGCSKPKQDPTKLPAYKDMTDPKNMPGMGAKPGAPAGTPAPATPGTP